MDKQIKNMRSKITLLYFTFIPSLFLANSVVVHH